MKKLLIIVGIVLVLLIAVVVALPFVVPKSTLVAIVEEQIEEATGREVVIGGEPEFSVFPEVKLSISNVSLSNAEGGKAKNLAEIGSADIEVDLMAAISGEVVVRKFILINPVIAIERDKNGRFNFELGDDGPGNAGRTDDPSNKGGTGEGLKLSLDDVRLENATLIYDDAQSGERHEVKGLNATLSLPAATGPFDMTADAEWQGRRIELVTRVDNPLSLSGDGSTATTATVSSGDLFKLDFQGTIQSGNAPKGAGKVSIDVTDLAGILSWLKIELGPDVKLPKTIGIAGDFTGSPEMASLAGATISFDNNQLTGSLSAGLTGGKPFAVADLNSNELDLRAYLPANEGGSGGGNGSAGGSSDWSEDKIDLSGLNAADADIRLRAGKITTGIVDTGKTDVAIVAKGRQTTLSINELQLYEGASTGKVIIDQRNEQPVITIDLDVKGLQARPMLTQLADYSDLLGTVNLSANLKTSGDTERKLVSGLNGKGNIAILDGAVIGYNLAAAMRNISTGGLDMTYDKSEKTDFAEITASFTARNGTVNNPDLKMNAPLLRVTGRGDIHLPPRTIDYRALPKLVASLTGQGASEGGGVGIPVLIKGSWDDPSIQPDLEGVVKGVLESPQGAVDAVKGVVEGGAVKGVTDSVKKVTEGGGGAVKGVLDSVTGGGSDKSDDKEEPAASDNPVSGGVKKLKGLFGN